jgi:hypothetical protein
MANKFLDFVQVALPGGTMTSASGGVIEVSANGTSTVPSKELEASIFKRFKEAHGTSQEEHQSDDA